MGANAFIAYLHKTLNQPLPQRRSQKLDKFIHKSVGAVAFRSGQVVEQQSDRYIEDFGNLLKATGANPVYPFLVFLNLLERNSERLAKSALAYPGFDAIHPDTFTYMQIGWIRRFWAGHFQNSRDQNKLLVQSGCGAKNDPAPI
jgi:hypothetical protein